MQESFFCSPILFRLFRTSLVFALALGVGSFLYSAPLNPEIETLYRENELNRFVSGHLRFNDVEYSPAKSIETLAFVSAAAKLTAALHSYQIKREFSKWFQLDNLIYIFSETDEGEQAILAEIFQRVASASQSEIFDLDFILKNSNAENLVAKVSHINDEVLRLKGLHKNLRRLALEKHDQEFNQRYGSEPYSYHLRNVRGVLKRFGFGPRDSLLGLRLGSEAWLHDILEDTDVSFEELRAIAGEEIALGVLGVTKLKPIPGVVRSDMLKLSYRRTAERQDSRILKLADRIANVEEGIVDLFEGKESKVKKYFREWPIFFQELFVEGEADEMWIYLERLLTDSAYAFRFVYGGARATFQCAVELGEDGPKTLRSRSQKSK